jgi:hypothetical protein
MRWKMDDQTLNDLEYDFSRRWREQGGSTIPEPLYAALRDRLGEDFKATLVHPVGVPGHVAFLIIDEEERVVRVEYHVGSETTDIAFLGSLAGGQYAESVRMAETGQQIEGVFSHPRSGEYRITLEPPPKAESYLDEFDARARDRTVELLAQLRRWSSEPLPPQP